MEKKPSVVMVGLGYIGLPTAALIASRGLHVTGVDVHQHVVDTINKRFWRIQERHTHVYAHPTQRISQHVFIMVSEPSHTHPHTDRHTHAPTW